MTPDEIDAEFAARSHAVNLEVAAMALASGSAAGQSFREITVDAVPRDPSDGRIEDRKFYVTMPVTQYKRGTGQIAGVRNQRYRLLLEPVEDE